jgi:hypothetical protein
MSTDGFGNSLDTVMKVKTVRDLIEELKKYPQDARVLLSADSEGNMYNGVYNVIDGRFGDDPEDKDDERLTRHELKTGEQYVIVWAY